MMFLLIYWDLFSKDILTLCHIINKMSIVLNSYNIKYTHEHLMSPLEVKYQGKKYLVFVNSKIGVIFGNHLGNGGHIEKLRNGSIAYFIQ